MDKKTSKKFTTDYIKGLACPNHLKQIYECLLPDIHLYISVAKGGTKSFTFRRKVEGTWRTLDLKCKFVDTLGDTINRAAMNAAKEKASNLTGSVCKGDNPFVEAKKHKDDLSLQELFNIYKSEHLEKKSKRVGDISNDFTRWFGKIAKRKVSAFSHTDANDLHERMKKTPYSANRAMQLGRALFNFGAKKKIISISDNPFSSVSFFTEVPRERFLSDEEAGCLLKHFESVPLTHCNERTLADLVILGLMTGARKANLLAMEWSEIDQNAWTWMIPAGKMKNGKAQTIPLGAPEIDVLTKRQQILKDAKITTPFVFPSKKSKSGHLVDIGNAWETLRANLKMEDLTIHDLRRSLASAMANSGANIAIVQGALSHSDIRTTLGAYIKTTQQAQLEARQRAQQGWFDAASKITQETEVDNVISIEQVKQLESVN